MVEEEYVSGCTEQMDKVIVNLKEGLKTIRSGVVSPAVLDKIYADYYGEKMPIKSLATVSAPTPTQLIVKPFDPTSVKAIVAAIGGSDLGINPVVNGVSIFLTFPPLSGERRQEFVKQAKVFVEQAKNSIRTVRSDVLGKAQKDKTLSEDMMFNLKSDVQKITDKNNKEIDAIFAEKQKALLTL